MNWRLIKVNKPLAYKAFSDYVFNHYEPIKKVHQENYKKGFVILEDIWIDINIDLLHLFLDRVGIIVDVVYVYPDKYKYTFPVHRPNLREANLRDSRSYARLWGMSDGLLLLDLILKGEEKDTNSTINKVVKFN